MARVTTATPHVARRNSRTVEKGESPFTSERDVVRRRAAERMLAKRRRELVKLRELADATDSVYMRRKFSARIAATESNMRSWADYIEHNYPKVDGAVVTVN